MISECVRCGRELKEADIAKHFKHRPDGDAKEDTYTTKHGTGR